MIKEIALLSPIYVTFFWAIVFLVRKNDSDKPKSYLGVLMLVAFMLYCSHAVFFSGLYHFYSYIESVYILTMLSVYPLYFLYILFSTTDNPGIKKQVLHFIPALALGILSLLTTFLLNTDERIFYVQDTLVEKNLKGLNWNTIIGLKGHIFFISRAVFIIQVVIYAFMGIKIANLHNKRVANYYSNIEGKTLSWVRDLNIVIVLAAVAGIVFSFIGRSYFTHHSISLLIPSFIFSAILFGIGYNGNKQRPILEAIIEKSQHASETSSSKLSHETVLKKELIQLFEKEKIYKHCDLRITNVCESLNTNRTYISRMINDDFDMNFNEFVNKYRLREAKELLASHDNNLYTMEYIAEKSGFGSVASFSRVFKESEGLTPGKYREIQKSVKAQKH